MSKKEEVIIPDEKKKCIDDNKKFFDQDDIIDFNGKYISIFKDIYTFFTTRILLFEKKLKQKYLSQNIKLPIYDDRLKINIKFNDSTFTEYINTLNTYLLELDKIKSEKVELLIPEPESTEEKKININKAKIDLELEEEQRRFISNLNPQKMKEDIINNKYKEIFATFNDFFKYGYYCFLKDDNDRSKSEFISKMNVIFNDLNKIDESFLEKYTENTDDYIFIKFMRSFDISSGGKSLKLKKTNNKIKVLYKKKEYTRVIYVNKNNKKFVKINKKILELSKLTKIK